jgi:DNA-directed RNA polymerase specialized sigma24 family protein
MFGLWKRLAWFIGRSALDRLDLPILGVDPGTTPPWPPRVSDDGEIAERLAAMPIMVREVYLLFAIDEMPIANIANRLAISQKEVARDLRHAVAILSAPQAPS